MLHRPHRLWYCCLTLGVASLLFSCEEDFQQERPFHWEGDTLALDGEDWFYLAQEPSKLNSVPAYPFSYDLFEQRFEGYLAKASDRVYLLESNDPEDRYLLLDPGLSPGDTLAKFSQRHYHLLLETSYTPDGEPVFYALRRSRKGVSSLEERQVWVIQPEAGILSVANYDIDPFSGRVTFDMTGDPEWFRDPRITELIKRYDYLRTYYLDRDRSLLFEFHKGQRYLRCRDIRAREELYRYEFQKSMLHLTNFQLRPSVEGIVLEAGDSCYQFSMELALIRSGLCR